MTAPVTPLERLPRLSRELGIDLRVKRDDLFPLTGGGNKARKMLHILQQIEPGCDALVTTGGTQSNHARVVALVAASRGWRCRLVLHGDPLEPERPQGNLRLAQLAGAEIVMAAPDDIPMVLDAQMAELVAQGCRPHQIPGGGHCLAGTLAFVDAMEEFAQQGRDQGWPPDFVLHASGTGATQAGLVAGVQRVGWPTRVIGVSVARPNPRGRKAVLQSYQEACAHLGLPAQTDRVDFRDGWVGAGYQQASAAVWENIRHAARTEGLILDPTYTGKAFTALVELVKREIPPRSRVLFWHTGGLLNLLAAERDEEES